MGRNFVIADLSSSTPLWSIPLAAFQVTASPQTYFERACTTHATLWSAHTLGPDSNVEQARNNGGTGPLISLETIHPSQPQIFIFFLFAQIDSSAAGATPNPIRWLKNSHVNVGDRTGKQRSAELSVCHDRAPTGVHANFRPQNRSPVLLSPRRCGVFQAVGDFQGFLWAPQLWRLVMRCSLAQSALPFGERANDAALPALNTLAAIGW